MKYKIVFDSNIIWQDIDPDKVFNSYIGDFKKFIEENDLPDNVEILIPEIVIKERIHQNLRMVDDLLKKAKSISDKLSPFKSVDLSEPYDGTDFESFLNKETDDFLKENGVEVIKNAIRSHEEILERAYKKIKPFSCKNNDDRGYKDTMIWLSILDDAKENKDDNYIICTKNVEDFDLAILSEEFKKYSGGDKLEILPKLQDVKEYLDKKLVLKLDLKKLYEEIEQEIQKKIGTIMVEVNFNKFGNKLTVPNRYGFSMVASDAYSAATLTAGYDSASYDYDIFNKKKKDKVGYDFKNINIDNINEIENETYSIKGSLTVIPKYKKDEESDSFMFFRLSDYQTVQEYAETLTMELNYNRKRGKIDLVFLS